MNTTEMVLLIAFLGCFIALAFVSRWLITALNESGKNTVKLKSDGEVYPEPLSVTITNTSDEAKPIHIFGFNFEEDANKEGVEIVNSATKELGSYEAMNRELALYPIKMALVRIKVNKGKLPSRFSFIEKENGISYEHPFEMSSYMYPKLKEIVDIPVQELLDSNSRFKMNIPENSDIEFDIFISQRYSLRAMLRACGVDTPNIRRRVADGMIFRSKQME